MPRRKKLVIQGSNTAKSGFKNEQDVADKFNNWRKDKDAQKWLLSMNYSLKKIEIVKAFRISGFKADVNVRVMIKYKDIEDIENLQVKLVSNPQGFNQVDKRWIDTYVEMWKVPSDIAKILKLFTGETKPEMTNGLKDKRRMTFNEMDKKNQNKIIKFFNKNKFLIISDILKGRGEFSADWVLVILRTNGNVTSTLKSINEVMNLYSQGDVRITSEGSLKIGKIGMQRKGGDGGRSTANMLQFKINPVEIFNIA